MLTFPALFARQPSMSVTPISLCVRRYLFALQVKQDLAQGRLTCNDTSAALLISHIVQCKFCWFPLEMMLEITQWSDWLERKSHPLKTIMKPLCSFAISMKAYAWKTVLLISLNMRIPKTLTQEFCVLVFVYPFPELLPLLISQLSQRRSLEGWWPSRLNLFCPILGFNIHHWIWHISCKT